MPFDPNTLLQGLETKTNLLEDWDDIAVKPGTKYIVVNGIQPNIELQDLHIDLSDAFARTATPVTVDLRGGKNLRDDHDVERDGPLPYQECLIKFSAPVIAEEAAAAIQNALLAQCTRRNIMFDDYSLRMDATYRP